MTPHAGSEPLAEVIVEAPPRAVPAPGTKALIGRLPRRQIMRHQAPGTATAQHILEAIDDFTHRVLAGSPAGLFWWQ